MGAGASREIGTALISRSLDELLEDSGFLAVIKTCFASASHQTRAIILQTLEEASTSQNPCAADDPSTSLQCSIDPPTDLAVTLNDTSPALDHDGDGISPRPAPTMHGERRSSRGKDQRGSKLATFGKLWQPIAGADKRSPRTKPLGSPRKPSALCSRQEIVISKGFEGDLTVWEENLENLLTLSSKFDQNAEDSARALYSFAVLVEENTKKLLFQRRFLRLSFYRLHKDLGTRYPALAEKLAENPTHSSKGRNIVTDFMNWQKEGLNYSKLVDRFGAGAILALPEDFGPSTFELKLTASDLRMYLERLEDRGMKSAAARCDKVAKGVLNLLDKSNQCLKSSEFNITTRPRRKRIDHAVGHSSKKPKLIQEGRFHSSPVRLGRNNELSRLPSPRGTLDSGYECQSPGTQGHDCQYFEQSPESPQPASIVGLSMLFLRPDDRASPSGIEPVLLLQPNPTSPPDSTTTHGSDSNTHFESPDLDPSSLGSPCHNCTDTDRSVSTALTELSSRTPSSPCCDELTAIDPCSEFLNLVLKFPVLSSKLSGFIDETKGFDFRSKDTKPFSRSEAGCFYHPWPSELNELNLAAKAEFAPYIKSEFRGKQLKGHSMVVLLEPDDRGTTFSISDKTQISFLVPVLVSDSPHTGDVERVGQSSKTIQFDAGSQNREWPTAAIFDRETSIFFPGEAKYVFILVRYVLPNEWEAVDPHDKREILDC